MVMDHSHTHSHSSSPTPPDGHGHSHSHSHSEPSGPPTTRPKRNHGHRGSYALPSPLSFDNGYPIPPSHPSPALAYTGSSNRHRKAVEEPFSSARHTHKHRHGHRLSIASLATPVLLAASLLLASLSHPHSHPPPPPVLISIQDGPLSKIGNDPVGQPPLAPQFTARVVTAAAIGAGALLVGALLQYLTLFLPSWARSAGNPDDDRTARKLVTGVRWGEVLRRALAVWMVYLAATQLGGVRGAVVVGAALAGGVVEGGVMGLMKQRGLGVAVVIAAVWDVLQDTRDWGILLAYCGIVVGLAAAGEQVWPVEGQARRSSLVSVKAGVILGVVAGLGWMSGSVETVGKLALGGVLVGGVAMAFGARMNGDIGCGIALITALSGGWWTSMISTPDLISEGGLAALTLAGVHFDHHPFFLSSSHSHGHSHSHAHDDCTSQPTKPPKPPSTISLQLLTLTSSHPLLHSILLDRDSRRITYFMFLNLSFMFIQTAYGFLTGSLGLISDSVHMFFDCLALAVGVSAAVMSKYPPSLRYPYGLGKMDTLAGFANGIFLMLISVEIVWEAIERLRNPTPMDRLAELLVVSIVGLAVNMVGMLAFDHAHMHGHSHGHSHSHSHGEKEGHGEDTHAVTGAGGSENMHGIFLHILADALGSVSVVISTILIHYTSWPGFDPLASVLIALLIFVSSIPLVTSAAKNLLITVDSAVEYELRETISGVGSVRGVESYGGVRFWGTGEGLMKGVVHVVRRRGEEAETVRRRVEEWGRGKGVEVVVQVEEPGEECWCRNSG
ncbi:cation efflux protein [Ascodesmis nigricans]|uniref:Zinc transporter n=1 Tax=Ascodesmis nigricans TaxID=341454 RepID=A0A4S2N141_9PEZI|nr:cation efflux protein [Ascodesmis nigricans]